MTESAAVLDRVTAELFDLDLRLMPVPMACENLTNDGCSASCPSVGCTPTCSCQSLCDGCKKK
jgi:hypothetical protein